MDRIADQIVDSASAERLVVRVIESRLLDEAVARLLESEDLWILVDEIARSPSVTEAIATRAPEWRTRWARSSGSARAVPTTAWSGSRGAWSAAVRVRPAAGPTSARV